MKRKKNFINSYTCIILLALILIFSFQNCKSSGQIKKIGKEKSLLIGHRGEEVNAPENTMPAFKLAVKNGMDGIEVDVTVLKDKTLVAFHDESLDRTIKTKKKGKKIKTMTWGEVQKLDAGVKFSKKFKKTRVPKIEEVVDAFGGKVWIIFDVKNPIAIGPLVKMLQDRGIKEKIIFAGADKRVLEEMHLKAADYHKLFWCGDIKELKWVNKYGITYVRPPKTPKIVEHASIIKNLGYKVVTPCGSAVKGIDIAICGNSKKAPKKKK
jgi:glycerophosphoryl diester phosphodiesterase